MYTCRVILLLALATIIVVPAYSAPPDLPSLKEDYDWVTPMKQVHAKFKGRPGTFALFGDSITWTGAYWTVLHRPAPKPYPLRNVPPEMGQSLKRIQGYMRDQCWYWKGKRFGNMPSMAGDWALQNVDEWLKQHNPEVALIMFGTNGPNHVPTFEKQIRQLVQKCLDNGTIVILSTIPPLRQKDPKDSQNWGDARAEAIRRIAGDLKIPLTDLYAEILRRRPKDWDGRALLLKAQEELKTKKVPDEKWMTLIGSDGCHLSQPVKYLNDYSPEALRNHGNNLRNYLTVLKYGEVIEKLLPARPKTEEEAREDEKFIDASPFSGRPKRPAVKK